MVPGQHQHADMRVDAALRHQRPAGDAQVLCRGGGQPLHRAADRHDLGGQLVREVRHAELGEQRGIEGAGDQIVVPLAGRVHARAHPRPVSLKLM